MPKSNKERLQDNNIALQNIKAEINTLPDNVIAVQEYDENITLAKSILGGEL